MESVIKKINESSKEIIKDNNFLFVAFQNRLILRLTHIFDKYKIPVNKNILNKNIEECLINTLNDINVDVINKYVKLLTNYERVIGAYVLKNTKTDVIKSSTMNFVSKIKINNKKMVSIKTANNYIERMNQMVFVYDNIDLNKEVNERIKTDCEEIINEFNRNNYNFVIESINVIIKNIISNM